LWLEVACHYPMLAGFALFWCEGFAPDKKKPAGESGLESIF
jgi:hypothetical protein